MSDKSDHCKCKYGGSPSSYHENCNTCHKYILTCYDKLDIKDIEIQNLREQLKEAVEILEIAIKKGIYNPCIRDRAEEYLSKHKEN
jgi:hypothetical protein